MFWMPRSRTEYLNTDSPTDLIAEDVFVHGTVKQKKNQIFEKLYESPGENQVDGLPPASSTVYTPCRYNMDFYFDYSNSE